MATPKFK